SRPRASRRSKPWAHGCPSTHACHWPGGQRFPLEDRQVLLDLPGGQLRAVVVPLIAFDLEEARDHVLAERLQDHLRLGCDLDRLAECLGQLLDAELLALV